MSDSKNVKIDLLKLYKTCLFFQGRGQPVTLEAKDIKQIILSAVPKEERLDFLTKVNDTELLDLFRTNKDD